MKLSDYTIQCLKNLASINPGIKIVPTEGEGTVLKTVSAQSNLAAFLKVEENFTDEIRLYDLPAVLSALSVVEAPEISVLGGNTFLIESEPEKFRCQVTMAADEMIQSVGGNISLPDVAVSFHLSDTTLQKLLRISSIFSLPNLVVSAGNGKVAVEIVDGSRSDSSKASIVVSESYTGENKEFFIKTELLKFIPGNYDVKIASQKVSEFTSEDGTRKYFVALESSK